MKPDNFGPALARRSFLLSATAVGGTLVIGFPVFDPDAAFGQAQGVELFNWIVVAPDNTVTIRVTQTEWGQGTQTAMAQMLAEEAELDWSKIKVEFPDTTRHFAQNKVYGRLGGGASIGISASQELLRRSGAVIRGMFIRAAAARLNVPAGELVAENSAVLHKASNRRLTYGELAAAAAQIPPADPLTVALKDPSEWKVIGKVVKRFDVPDKVNGKGIFGIDVRVPGMKFGAIQTSPVFGGKLKSFDANAAMSREGVRKVVEIKGGIVGGQPIGDDGVVVVADTWWQAKSALDAMPKEWDSGPNATKTSADFAKEFQAGLTEKATKDLRKEGDVDAAFKSAAKVLEAEYDTALIEHATMEPHNCTALVTDDRYELWVGTSAPEGSMETASAITGLPLAKGKLNIPLLGGGFGRRSGRDFVAQAVQVAQQMKGTPVQVLWSREETTRHGRYRAAHLSKMRGALDANGNVVAWQHRLVSSSDNAVYVSLGADSLLYNVPNMLVDLVVKPNHVPLGALRGVAYAQNCFYTQCFTDELARAAGKDPYQFLRALLDPEKTPATVPKGQLRADFTPKDRAGRLRRVLDEAAQKSDWGGKPLGPNRGRGIATEEEASSFFAAVAEVTLDGNGWFTVDRVVFAGDVGNLVSPDNAAAQLEGGAAYGMTAAMYGEITINNGRVVQGNFDDYQIMRIHEMPKVESHFVRTTQHWGGVGEPSVSVVGPAIANAIYDAGGPRIRSQPFKNVNIMMRS